MVAGLLVAVLVVTGGNVPAFYRLNELQSNTWDALMPVLTHLIGDGLIVAGALGLFLLYQRKLTAVGVLLVTLLLSLVVVNLLKGSVFPDELRPAGLLAPDSFKLVGDPTLKKHSFPSGHATTAFAAMAVLAFAHPRVVWVQVLALGLAALGAYSRVYVGVHFPYDILAGMLLGTLLAVGAMRFTPVFERWQEQAPPHRAQWVAYLLWGLAGVALLAGLVSRFGAGWYR